MYVLVYYLNLNRCVDTLYNVYCKYIYYIQIHMIFISTFNISDFL